MPRASRKPGEGNGEGVFSSPADYRVWPPAVVRGQSSRWMARMWVRGQCQILHDERHRLDVPDRVLLKLAVTVHRCLNGRAPPYLSNYCVPVAGADKRQLAASAFRQPQTNRSTSLPAQHLRPSGLVSRRPHSLELSPGFHPGPDYQCRLFQTFA